MVNLRAFRLMNELSQKEVADYLEVSIAFISSIERGQAKLPIEKLARLLENDREWETAPLLDQGGKGTRVHHDHRTISNNMEGEFNAPVHNNNYSGFSDEEFERELERRTALKDQQIAALEAEIERLRIDLARERSINERFMGILEKGEFRKGEEA
jgi:transcriptional regulator with XRE-family HTH domain